MCEEFGDSKKHMHARVRPDRVLETESNLRVHVASAVLFETNAAIPEEILNGMDELTALEAKTSRSFRHQHFAVVNDGDHPTAGISYDPSRGLQLFLDPMWLSTITDRFEATRKSTDSFVEA